MISNMNIRRFHHHAFYYMKKLRCRDSNLPRASHLLYLSFVAEITVTNHFKIQWLQMTVPYVA